MKCIIGSDAIRSDLYIFVYSHPLGQKKKNIYLAK